MSSKQEQLKQLQCLPLQSKIIASERRIKEWYEHYDGDVTVSFSGGKDSTVLLHLVRQLYPEVKAIFVNTGLEYPEIVDFVRTIPNVIELRPKKDFLSVVKRYGYPVVSKRMAQYIGNVQTAKDLNTATAVLRLTGVTIGGKESPMSKISDKWIKLALQKDIKISDQCCKYLKKDALDSIPSHPYVGTMASDSAKREQSWYQYGCNAFDIKSPRSAPISFWNEEDIWNYLTDNNIPYCKIYDMGYSRTGCSFCLFGLHLEKRPNRFERMAITHPQLFKYCMDGPLALRNVIKVVYGMDMPVI